MKVSVVYTSGIGFYANKIEEICNLIFFLMFPVFVIEAKDTTRLGLRPSQVEPGIGSDHVLALSDILD